MAADLDAKRPDESLAFLAMLTSPTGYAPLHLGACAATCPRRRPTAASTDTGGARAGIVSPECVVQLCRSLRRCGKCARPSGVHLRARSSALLGATTGAAAPSRWSNASLACVARAVAAALHTSPAGSGRRPHARQLEEPSLWVLMGCAAQPAMCRLLCRAPLTRPLHTLLPLSSACYQPRALRPRTRTSPLLTPLPLRVG